MTLARPQCPLRASAPHSPRRPTANASERTQRGAHCANCTGQPRARAHEPAVSRLTIVQQSARFGRPHCPKQVRRANPPKADQRQPHHGIIITIIVGPSLRIACSSVSLNFSQQFQHWPRGSLLGPCLWPRWHCLAGERTQCTTKWPPRPEPSQRDSRTPNLIHLLPTCSAGASALYANEPLIRPAAARASHSASPWIQICAINLNWCNVGARSLRSHDAISLPLRVILVSRENDRSAHVCLRITARSLASHTQSPPPPPRPRRRLLAPALAGQVRRPASAQSRARKAKFRLRIVGRALAHLNAPLMNKQIFKQSLNWRLFAAAHNEHHSARGPTRAC